MPESVELLADQDASAGARAGRGVRGRWGEGVTLTPRGQLLSNSSQFPCVPPAAPKFSRSRRRRRPLVHAGYGVVGAYE